VPRLLSRPCSTLLPPPRLVALLRRPFGGLLGSPAAVLNGAAVSIGAVVDAVLVGGERRRGKKAGKEGGERRRGGSSRK